MHPDRRVARAARKIDPWLFLAVLFAGLAAAPVTARALRIQDFHAELDVLPDSPLDVTETLRVQFIGTWQGIYRTIPVEYSGPGGFNYSLFLSEIKATDGADGSGTSLRVERRRQGRELLLRIYVPGASDATRTISLHYHLANALRYFPDHDELYWNVTGTGWTDDGFSAWILGQFRIQRRKFGRRFSRKRRRLLKSAGRDGVNRPDPGI